jgi:hypothetical protein
VNDPATCEHRNWFAWFGQPARCKDCGAALPKPPPVTIQTSSKGRDL